MATTNVLRFVLDGQLVELADIDPNRTVLQWLREDLCRTGSKEGCAEGDCGACTVAVAGHRNGKMTLSPVNSCIQFLPTLHGKELLTVESLSRPGDASHPVQRAMIEQHGSQCGFCTPGFIMSMFALYETNPQPSRCEIDTALAGNLCRCTGYRPIVSAARAMYGYPRQDVALHPELLTDCADDDLEIEHQGRRFFSPASMNRLLELRSAWPDATLLAGGTDAGLWVTKQHRVLDTIIYTARVAELARVDVGEQSIDIGAAVSLADAADALVPYFPGVRDIFDRFASPPIRNAGTLGGNVANGSPIGDSMPWLMAVGAILVLRSVDGSREVPIEDFYCGYMENDLQDDELLERIRIPRPSDGTILRSYKLSKRFDQDISALCVAFRLELDGNRARSFRVACGGMAATVMRARNCEAAVNGKPWNRQTIRHARAALDGDYTPISDMRASANYRERALKNLLTRFFLETQGKLDVDVYRYGRPD